VARQAIELFKEAIRIDPDYALAYVGLVESYDVYRGMGSMPEGKALEAMDSLVDMALSLDGSLGEAYTELGNIRGRQHNFDAAEAAYLRALELSPNYPTLYSRYGVFLYYARQNKQVSVQMQKSALAVMRRAVDEGLRSGWWELPTNMNLQSLWDEPEFKSMLAEIEADMTAQRKAIRADSGESDVIQQSDS